jgi:hypothetical protein
MNGSDGQSGGYEAEAGASSFLLAPSRKRRRRGSVCGPCPGICLPPRVARAAANMHQRLSGDGVPCHGQRAAGASTVLVCAARESQEPKAICARALTEEGSRVDFEELRRLEDPLVCLALAGASVRL